MEPKTPVLQVLRSSVFKIEDPNNIAVEDFVGLCKCLPHLYDNMFSLALVRSTLKNDIHNSSMAIQRAAVKYDDQKTLQSLINEELRLNDLALLRRDKKCGVLGVLWAKRAVQFVSVFLKNVIEFKQLGMSDCAKRTYDEVLKPYHGWFISTVVGLAMTNCPTREKMFLKLDIQAEEELVSFVAKLEIIVAAVHKLLDENECNFPDKA